MSFIVTGAAGFIGSNLVQGLNREGYDNVIAVDDLTRADKFKNLVNAKVSNYLDKDDLLNYLKHTEPSTIQAILHQGACSDTMASDGRYVMRNNYQYTRDLYEFAVKHNIPFLYASSAAVYGASKKFIEDIDYEKPLNVYGYSKFLFDQFLRQELAKNKAIRVAGFRYFNVYGPHEQHKGRMASVAYHHFNEYHSKGYVQLFEGRDGYSNGGQQRDFVLVGDVVSVNLSFLKRFLLGSDRAYLSGIYNLGTGRAQSFNDVAVTTVNTLRGLAHQPLMTLAEMVKEGIVRYIDFPSSLIGKYQSYTQADMTALRHAGYEAKFATVEEGVKTYIEWLANNS